MERVVPVLDAHPPRATHVRAAGEVTAGEQPWQAGAPVLVDDDAVVHTTPAVAARSVSGRTPIPTTTVAAGIVCPSGSSTASTTPAAVQRRDPVFSSRRTPCWWCSAAKTDPSWDRPAQAAAGARLPPRSPGGQA